MPPKRSGKGRKKAAESVKSVTITGNEDGSVRKNGEELRVDENEAPPPNGDVENEKASMVPEAVGKRGRPKSKETKTIRSGEELNGNGEAIDPETEHSKIGRNEVDMDVNEDSSKKRGLRRKAPLQSMEIASESDVMTNTEQEGKTKIRAGRNARQTKETAPKKAKGERNAQQSSSEAARENLVSEEDLQADEETKEIIPQETKESQNDEQLSADVKSVKDDSAPKKTRSRAAKHITEEKDADKNAPQKTRNAKQSSSDIPGIISSLVDTEPKEMSSKGVRGRKRKNVQTEKGTEDVLGTRIMKVSLLRQKSVDDMALEELKKSEVNVKVAVGTSNPRGKRGREDGGDGGRLAKVSKASSSKLPKKKIPDVSALDFGNTSTTASGESWNLKIVSWNINGIRAWLEKDGMSYLLHEQPDIVCFQETKCSENKLPEEANMEGYHCYWLGGDKEGYSGVGLLSKKKPLSVDYGIGMENYTEGRVITADYDKFYLVAAYVPNAGRALVRLDYRKQWDVDFRAYLKKLDETKPVILCGDLNVAHQEIDLANPKSNKKNAGFTKEERDGFSALLSEGFVDTYRYLYPDTTSVYTFWTYMMNSRAKNVGWRIDYFVMSERFADRLCDCCTRKDVMGSDHCPLVLFLCV